MKGRMIIPLAVFSALFLSCSDGRERSVSPQSLKGFQTAEREIPKDSSFLTGDLYSVILDSSVFAALDTVCTYRVSSSGVTDQMKAGLCWAYSTLNVLRSEVIQDDGFSDFEFSQAFVQFYDVLEKSNLWLENVIDNRRKPLDSRKNNYLFKKPIGDGGLFTYAARIIAKYGIVPKDAMPSSFNVTQNARLMRTASALLRKYGMELRGADKKDIQRIKSLALGDIYHLLVQTLGTPPSSFGWNGEDYTPESFRDKFVRHDLESDYVTLMNDPSRRYYKMYQVENSKDCYEMPEWTFLNLPMDVLEDLGTASLKDGRMFYFSCDTYHGDEESAGRYSDSLHDFSGRLGVDPSMSKADRIASGEIVSAHAIAMSGVRIGSDGRPLSWVAENSYGVQRGFGGYIVMDSQWLESYLLRMAVEKRFLPDSLKSLLASKPEKIPFWNLCY